MIGDDDAQAAGESPAALNVNAEEAHERTRDAMIHFARPGLRGERTIEANPREDVAGGDEHGHKEKASDGANLHDATCACPLALGAGGCSATAALPSRSAPRSAPPISEPASRDRMTTRSANRADASPMLLPESSILSKVSRPLSRTCWAVSSI